MTGLAFKQEAAAPVQERMGTYCFMLMRQGLMKYGMPSIQDICCVNRVGSGYLSIQQ